ncbi:hypothetical protein BGW80DRAFT_1455117 [Lactifluus volemus]|nr:hypothetical protein BGW80DRAFT_1455117 [Lactifluus volemus]
MTFGRTSSFSKPLFLTVIWLVGLLPVVRADCWIDVETNIEHCDGLSSAARLGIGLAFFFLFFAVLMSLMIRRRRRNAQANLAFIQPQPGNQFGNNGGSQPFPPQYPPQAYNSSPYVYDPATGFAPPTNSPPHYAPPPGVPPISSGDYKGGVMA